ncbi:uncharacterized protein LOC135708884 [Ochlerotatus camptorhynchus]|uniref:uncharacterized protein LOC135708884 n=1 Tax=Ochlerotatus camptorhynchus TaxID=644619 RepID=UPI0031D0403F
MMRIVLWSIWISSGVLILLLLGGIVTIMVQPPNSALGIQPRFDAVNTIASTTQGSIVDEDAQDVIKIVYGRKGYSNPKPTSEDEDDAPDMAVRQIKRTRRPLRIIGKDFNPYQSYTVKHRNGTLTYVFPSTDITSSTTSTSNSIGDVGINPTTVIDREGSSDPLETYPTELIDEIMNQHINSFEGAFGNDMVNGDKLNSRFDISNDQYFCDSEETLIHPAEGFTWQNSSVRIVNTKNYKQGVRIEKCRNEGKPCKFCDGNTVCKQLYHYRTLVAINLDARKPYRELIQLPSCCKCARISL